MNLKEKNETLQDKSKQISLKLSSTITSLINTMSERYKKEWEFFRNCKNIVGYNERCNQCKNKCKQSFRAEIISCPNFNLSSCVK